MSRRRSSGELLVVEGPDSVGKSTVCSALASRLLAEGHDLLDLAFPGKQPGTLGDLVYRIHHGGGPVDAHDMSELAKQALHVAAHIDAIEREIVPALRARKTVVLDRFWWSAWVYGLVRHCDADKLKALVDAERAAWGRVRPALAVLLKRSTPIARDEPLPNWRRLVDEYDRLIERERRQYRCTVVENAEAPETAVDAILREAGMARRFAWRRPTKDSRPVPTIGRTGAAISTHILPLKPSVVYDTYWRFAVERQEIFFRRLAGHSPPWTTDRILAEYKFTNAYRASDRVSQYLIRQVIYREDLPSTTDEIFFRVMLFKLFNKIETWEFLQRVFGQLTFEDYKFERYDKVLTSALDCGVAIYSAAYIMPSAGRGQQRKHRTHLLLLERMLADAVPDQLAECRGMQQAFELLRSYSGIGDFLAYQYAIDLNYSELMNFNESDFVVPGPGALDGIRKCFIDSAGLNAPEIIKFMADRQEREMERLGLTFRSLWGRPLQLIDCQSLFCEVDKHARARHPDIEGISGRSRIKQRLDAKPSLPDPWYPPKWGLNETIAKWREQFARNMAATASDPDCA